MKYVFLAAALVLGLSARAQTVSSYDTFPGSTLDASKWQVINEDGSALAGTGLSGGVLTVNGNFNRTGAASNARIGNVGAVEVDALGWSGTNQILQLYSGDGTSFNHFIEYGWEGKESDGTPLLHVWTADGGEVFHGDSPTPGPVDATHPLHMRVERNGNAYRFLANGTPVYTGTSNALDNDARVFLYGWQTSASKWRGVQISGPNVLLTAPAPGIVVGAAFNVTGRTAAGTGAWTLQEGAGADPQAWNTLTSGTGSASVTAKFDPATVAGGLISFRLVSADANGVTRSAWSTVNVDRATLVEPFDGQIVGPSFPALVQGGADYVRAQFLDNGTVAAETTSVPFTARLIPAADGDHAISATLFTADGRSISTATVHVTVQQDLYGGYTRPADLGRAFVFPNGATTVPVAHNDSYSWPGLSDFTYANNNASGASYIQSLQNNGVNMVRVFLEDAGSTGALLENPIGTFQPIPVSFWDRFLPLCAAHNITVTISPWDTFWINIDWSTNPYNAANGGPCQSPHDFIVNPVARQLEKNRLKFMIDRWGNSPAIFSWDILNEFDIWWDASDQERQDWINDMVNYVQSYELQKWGHRHMMSVSAANHEPGGIIGDIIYRDPRFEWAQTHLYYGGTVNDPQNLINPALDINHGVRYALGQIMDRRPYTDSESGPIDNWQPNGQPEPFDDQTYHHEAWAHFASGGAGPTMRWPYRNPHILTDGMHATQLAISRVAKGIDWTTYQPNNADSRLTSNRSDLILMGSGDANQAVVWVAQDVRSPVFGSFNATVTMNGWAAGHYSVKVSNTLNASPVKTLAVNVTTGAIVIPMPPMSSSYSTSNYAVTIRRLVNGDANTDGVVDINDSILLLRIAAGLAYPTPQAAGAADVNGDGVLDILDATRVLLAAEGLDPL